MHGFKALPLVLSIIFFGCSNNSTADLIGETPDVVRYSAHVQPVISANCTVCHNNPPLYGAPISLTSYEHVRTAILEHGLLDRISRPQGAPGMMPNGGTRLPQATIDLLVQWEADGFQQ